MPAQANSDSGPAAIVPEAVDYSDNADLYAVQRPGKKSMLYYHRFDTVAQALKFVVEDLPAHTSQPVIEINERRYVAAEIRALYDAAAYPLARRAN